MDDKQILNLLGRYKAELGEKGFKALEAGNSYRFDPLKLNYHKTKTKALGHVLWMCNEIEKMLNVTPVFDEEITAHTKTVEKAHRWLGFIQGILWIFGVYTIDEMRNQNR